jgi:hypothetical protein
MVSVRNFFLAIIVNIILKIKLIIKGEKRMGKVTVHTIGVSLTSAEVSETFEFLLDQSADYWCDKLANLTFFFVI